LVEKKKDLRGALVDSGLLSQDQIRQSTEDGRRTGESLIWIILKKKLLNEKQVLKFLEEEMGIPHVSLSSYLIDQKTIEILPPMVTKKYNIIPLFLVEKTLSLAMVDPFDIKAIDEVRKKTGLDVEVMAATPTAMAVAIATVHPQWGNSSPMQLELDPGVGKGEEGVQNIMNLIRTHFDLGGTQVNLNIVDKAKILAAHKDPASYPDLIVRVTGFSAYFCRLTPEFRQLVMDRIIAEE
jgi:hypothetical protein